MGGFAESVYSIKGGAVWLLDARLSNLCPLDNLPSRRLLPEPPLIIPPLCFNTSRVACRPIPPTAVFNTLMMQALIIPPLCLILITSMSLDTQYKACILEAWTIRWVKRGEACPPLVQGQALRLARSQSPLINLGLANFRFAIFC